MATTPVAAKKRVADILAEELANLGHRTVFLVTGGGAMHLNDAFGREKRFRIVFSHHEQASAMSAEAYGRVLSSPAVLNVTTGPGGINALNGVFGAYTDSIPMVVVSGQVKRETIAANYSRALRQLGDQEVDIISMVKPITKYAVTVQNPKDILKEVQKAAFLAMHGRPGPVWLDVPVDVQGTLVDPSTLESWDRDLLTLRSDPHLHQNTLLDAATRTDSRLEDDVAQMVEKLASAKRPVIMLGTGVRLSGTGERILAIAERLSIPVVTAFNAHDLVPTESPVFAGRPGTIGDRAGNFAVQNSDVLFVLGCRLNIRQISYNWKSFAERAWVAHVDVDGSELDKPTFSADLKVHADLRDVVQLLESALLNQKAQADHEGYRKWCRERLSKYPVVLESYRSGEVLNPYHFMERLFDLLGENETVVTANATACIVSFQVAKIRKGTRLFSNSGSASMGYDLPAAVGAAVAQPGRRVIALAGDGSIMMNLQELETIVGNQLPVTVLLINNNGYHSIRQTQKAYFSDSMVGIDPSTGVTFPDFTKVAAAFGLKTWKIATPKDLDLLPEVLAHRGPCFCEIVVDPKQDFAPKLTSRRLPDGTMLSPKLEDMSPFLSREELAENLLE